MDKPSSVRRPRIFAFSLDVEHDLGDDGNLTLAERGARIRMFAKFRATGSLPSDEGDLFRVTRAVTEKKQSAVRRMVSRYFRADGLGHLRLIGRGTA